MGELGREIIRHASNQNQSAKIVDCEWKSLKNIKVKFDDEISDFGSTNLGSCPALRIRKKEDSEIDERVTTGKLSLLDKQINRYTYFNMNLKYWDEMYFLKYIHYLR